MQFQFIVHPRQFIEDLIPLMFHVCTYKYIRILRTFSKIPLITAGLTCPCLYLSSDCCSATFNHDTSRATHEGRPPSCNSRLLALIFFQSKHLKLLCFRRHYHHISILQNNHEGLSTVSSYILSLRRHSIIIVGKQN